MRLRPQLNRSWTKHPSAKSRATEVENLHSNLMPSPDDFFRVDIRPKEVYTWVG
jgi:hypothetical protein